MTLLDGVDLDVTAGEWVTIVGPNGAGKSTLLRVMAGLQPYEGSLRLTLERSRDVEVRALPARQLARTVATVAQHPEVPVGMMVVDYVLLGRTAHLGLLQRDGGRDRRIVMDSLAQLELAAFAERRLETLSGGEQQRVFLARALAQQPSVLLLDEPTSALDLGHQLDVLELVDRLRGSAGLTVVSTMHDLTLAGEFADRLVLLDRGRVVRVGSPTEVLEPGLLGETYRASVRVLPAAPASGRRGPVVIPVRSEIPPVR